jgi:PA domain.
MKKLILLFAIFSWAVFPQQLIEKFAGEAFANNYGYKLLGQICDLCGGRLMGSPEMEKAIYIVSDKLTEAGYKPFREYFPNPVWHRGEDEVVLTRPFRKKLRAYALGWVTQAEVGDAEAIYVSSGYSDDYDGIDAKGKIAVISQERPAGKEELLRMEAIKIAADHGAVACLFINERPKGKVLLGAGNFKGVATPVPAFTLTFEEGNKLKRLLTSGELVKLDIFF